MRYRFGNFELDTRAYRLTCSGQVRKLQPKVLEVLALLVERRGTVVTKQDLLDALWPGEHVGDATVTWSVSFARRALDQGRNDKLPIETIHARGYRFSADVEVLDERAPSTPPATSAQRTASIAPRSSALPFVGREAVMQRLLACLDDATHAHGRLCLLVGDAGIGKTRCAEELIRVADARGVQACVGRATELGGAPALHPWKEIVRELARKRPTLRAACDALLLKLSPTTSVSDDGSQANERFALFEALVDLLRDAAAEAPLLLVLDDLHWADTASVEALAFAAPSLAQCPLLLVATQRDEAEEHNQRALGRLSRVAERMSLSQLSTDDIAAYVAQLAPGVSASTALQASIQRATAGNALFVQELVRSLLDTHGAQGFAGIAPDSIRPPVVARDVLRAPLTGLGAPTLELLGCAAVLGDTFELSLLQELSQLDVDGLLDQLETAVRRELVIAEAPHRYRFRHVLLRDVLYDDLPASRRVALHRRAAEWLASRGPQPARPDELALHYYRSLAAGDPAAVTAAAHAAARAAERVFSHDAATVFYGWALQAQGQDPTATPRQRAELLFWCGDAQRAAGRDEQARDTLRQMIAVAREHGFADLLVRAARTLRPIYVLGTLPDTLVLRALEDALHILPVAPSHERVSALSQLACVPPIAHDMPRSKVLSHEALALARELPPPATASLLEALRARMYALSGPDDLDALLVTCDEVLALDAGRTWQTGEAHAARLATFMTRGDAAACDAALSALEAVSHKLGRVEGQWFAARLRAQRLAARGEFDAAVAAYDALLARAKHVGLSYGVRFVQLLQMLLWRERVGVGAFAAQLLPVLQQPPTPDTQHGGLAFRARLLVEVGALELARSAFEALAVQDFEDIPKESSYLSALCHLSMVAIALGDRPRVTRLRELLTPYASLYAVDLMAISHGPITLYLAQLQTFLNAGESA